MTAARVQPMLDLTALINEALEETTDFYDAADAVIARLDDETVWAALAIILPGYVRDVGGQRRRHGLSAVAPSVQRSETTSRQRSSGTRPVGVAAKKAAGDERWQRAMESMVPLKDGQPARALGSLRLDEVLVAASIRKQAAAATLVWAKRYEALAKKMQIHRAAVVRDLPPDYFWEAMQ